MEIIKRFFWLALVIILLPVASLATDAPQTKKDSSVRERKAITEEWLAAGKNVVAMTGDENGKAIMDFLRDSHFLAIPEKDEKQLALNVESEPKNSQFQVALIPVLTQDQNAGAEWKKLYEKNQAATFIPGPEFGVIVLKKTDTISKAWKGLILLHEGSHALANAVGVFSDISDMELKHAVDERYAYSQEFDILAKLGGKAYQKILKEEAGRIEIGYLKEKSVALPVYQYKKNLDAIFGPAKSEYEDGIRGSVLWLQAVFAALEKVHGKDGAEKKEIDFLWSAYRDGILK